MDNNQMYEQNQNLMDINQSDIASKRLLNRLGLALSIMAAAILFTQFLLGFILKSSFPGAEKTQWYTWVLTGVSVVLVGLPTFYGVTRNIPVSFPKPIQRLKLTQFIVIFLICAAAMYVTNYISVFINLMISIIKGEDLLNPALDAIYGGSFWITLIYTGIIAPIVEEIIFRKIMLDRVRRFGDLPAILLTGIAFGLFHMNLAQILYATALGIIFAYVTIKTNTIRYSILLHVMINVIGATIAPLAVKAENLLYIVILMIWVFGSIAAGVTLLIVNRNKITLDQGEITVGRKSIFILNTGTILFILICLIMTVSLILA